MGDNNPLQNHIPPGTFNLPQGFSLNLPQQPQQQSQQQQQIQNQPIAGIQNVEYERMWRTLSEQWKTGQPPNPAVSLFPDLHSRFLASRSASVPPMRFAIDLSQFLLLLST
jgi:hypothetical protein